jgi:hypothetical protein
MRGCMISAEVVGKGYEEDMMVFVRLRADETIAFKHGPLRRREDGSKRRVSYPTRIT